jgi:CYTH domain-containing protein
MRKEDMFKELERVILIEEVSWRQEIKGPVVEKGIKIRNFHRVAISH